MSSRNFSIGQRIALGFAIPLVALILIGFGTIRNVNEMQASSRLVTQTVEIMSDLRNFSEAVSRIESAGRGYVISGDESLKDDLAAYAATAEQTLRKIKDVTASDPKQQERCERLFALLERRHQISRDLMRSRDETQQFNAVRAATLVRDGERVSDQIRDIAREMLDQEIATLGQRRLDSLATTNLTERTVIYGSIFALIIVTLGGYALSRSIVIPVSALKSNASRIGEGDYSHRVNVDRDDELGELGRVFNVMASQVEERQRALAQEDWLKTAIAKFNQLFQQQRNAAQVCEIVLTELGDLVGAQRSAVYRVKSGEQGDELELVASHAADDAPRRLRSGEGLVGQAMVDLKRVHLTEVPASYHKVSSALGETAVSAVLIEPVTFEGRIKAVMELASLKPFTPLQLEMLAQLSANLGIVLQTIESVVRTEELLRESQALTTQLEQQQSALEEKNKTLEEQTERLRKSEILLQEQQAELTQTNEELEQSNEELQQSNEELEEKSNMLAIRRAELEASNQAIEKARLELQEQARQLALSSKYKSDFLATMSHELRTPLNSLLILARLLSENREGNLSSKQVQFAQTIESSGMDLLEMINQILDLAKIESGTVEFQLEDLAIPSLQQAVEQQFRHIAEQKKLDFSVTLAPDTPPTIHTDGRRLSQVLKNLLSNAFKFTEKGHVRVEIRGAKSGWTRRTTALDRAKSAIAISISDSGIGIPPEKQEIIFESFQQADAGTARRYGGTGLGLSISREIAHRLGGVLQLESEVGKGSTFTLYLPLSIDQPVQGSRLAPQGDTASTKSSSKPAASAPATPAPQPQPEPEPIEEVMDDPEIDDDRNAIGSNDRVILIVEDDVRFARILVDFSREKRFKTVVARTARQALAMAARFNPAAITLDLRLVDEDGWVVLDRLKHDERTRHIPVHVISVDPARGRGLRLGAVSYLQKPVSKDAIQQVLQQTIDFIERPVKSLLVVEDDDVQRNTIRELIGEGDVDTTGVGTAAEALEALEKHRFDCVVIDLMLPDKPGIDLIREINSRLGLQAPPVIVYTGKELSQREETELRSLSDSIIVKDARSPERLLDETALFLHRIQSRMPESKRRMLEQVRKQDALLTGRRVLVVDDDVRNIFALTAALETYGMNVQFAESGKAALDLLDADPAFDIVLMDVMMPGIDGYETIRRLRKDSRFARLPIISVTAKVMKGDRERCIEAGASDYITKPVDTDKLISLLRVWLYR